MQQRRPYTRRCCVLRPVLPFYPALLRENYRPHSVRLSDSDLCEFILYIRASRNDVLGRSFCNAMDRSDRNI